MRRSYVGPLVVALMAFPTAIVLLASRVSLGMSPDSVDYAAAARSFAQSGRLLALDGSVLTVFPPGLPVLLGSLSRLGFDLMAAAAALQAACVAVTVLLAFILATRAVGDARWALCCAAAVSVSASIAYVHSMLWSEPLFTALVLGSLVLLAGMARAREVTWPRLAVVAALVSAACCVRFAGVALLPVVAVGVAMGAWRGGRGRALALSGAATGASAAGLIAVVARDVAVGAPALGERILGGLPLPVVATDALAAAGWSAFPGASTALLVGAGVALAGVALVAVVAAVCRCVSAGQAQPCARVVIVIAAWVSCSLALVVASELSTSMDPIDARLVQPVLAPAVILVAAGLRAIVRALPVGWPRALLVAAGVVAVASAGMNIRWALEYATQASRSPVGYASPGLASSPAARAIQALPAGGIAASDPAWVYWSTGRQPVFAIPRRDHYWPAQRTREGAQRLVAAVHDGRVGYLAFLDAAPTAFTPSDVASLGLVLTDLGRFPGGQVFGVS